MKYAMRRARIGEPKQAGELELNSLDLTRLMTGIETRITSLIRWASLVVLLLIVSTVSYVVASANQQHHDDVAQCRTSNKGRAEITVAFGTLYDGFVSATHNNPAAITFKQQGMAKLAKGLPQRQC